MATLRFSGSAMFRQKIGFAVLSGRPVRIDNIRADDEAPGLRDFEACFLRLVDKLTNGTRIEIDETGTTLKVRPGFITGGRVAHDCGDKRAIGYFIEGVLPLLPFAKKATVLTLDGITNDPTDPTVDSVRNVTLPVLWHFGVADDLSIDIKRRGAPPIGGGQVVLKCPVVQELTPMQLTREGFIRRIRGVAYSTRVAPTLCNRVVDRARGVLNSFVPDVFVYTDHYSGKESGRSPGFGLTLVAESTTNVLLSAEVTAGKGTMPEDVGEQCARLLCEEISKRGCIDSDHQALVLTLMALTPEDVSKVRIGPLTPFAIATLRMLREVFGVVFKITPDTETDTLVASCLGCGFKNKARKFS